MFAAIISLLLLPLTDLSRSRGMQFRPLIKIAFYIFAANFFILMQLGAKHVESPFIEFGQTSTIIYFLYFFILLYAITLFENSLSTLHFSNKIPFDLTIIVPINYTNIKKSSFLPSSDEKPIKIYIGIDIGKDTERFIPMVWGEEGRFVRDQNADILYKGSKCFVDEKKDNDLVESNLLRYLRDECVCVCNS
jgi:hypothetical protein